jgi:hypothetical protein
MATNNGGADTSGGTTFNPAYTQYAGRWNAAQASKTPVLNRPSDTESLRRSIALIAGGNLNAGVQNKVQQVKSVSNFNTFTTQTIMPDKTDLKHFAWNLPPHLWSRPVDPSQFDNAIGYSSAWDGVSNPVNRRGRIYWYSRVDTKMMNGKTTNLETGLDDPRYGFQFLWNPESFSTSVSINPDITPSANDKFVQVVGAFPSGETLSVSLIIDRTNDLYCLRSHNLKDKYFTTNYDIFYEYYKGYSWDSANGSKPARETFNNKISALQTLGTLADLEYLYKAINGPGWKNAATGRQSSDIGFLSPTLLKIEIGPVAYLGNVAGINVNHVAFTKGMIPMRTELSIGFNLMATAGLSSKA